MTSGSRIALSERLVIIRWLDSMGYDRWETAAELWAKLVEGDGGLEHLTVGWIVREDEQWLMIAGSRQAGTGEVTFNGTMVIPKVAVLHRASLEEQADR